MKYPAPLKAGSKIAVTAFSSGVSEPIHRRLDIVLNHLRDSGYQVIEGECLRTNIKHVSGSAQARAQELMRFLCDDSIDAIMPPWGGEFAMDILPLLDYDLLAKAKPKWVMGFSDISTLMVTLTTKLDWASAHGTNLMQLHPSESERLTASTLSWLQQKEGAFFTQEPSSFYQIANTSFADNPEVILNTTEVTRWKVLGKSDEASFSGCLIGGCFDVMTVLIGTPYFDMEQFHENHREDGVILYLENAEMSPTYFKRALLSLKFKGIFDLVNGVMLGRNAVMDNAGCAISSQEALEEALADLSIPVVYDMDIGHLPPNLTLINGAFAEVCVRGGQGNIVQTLK